MGSVCKCERMDRQMRNEVSTREAVSAGIMLFLEVSVKTGIWRAEARCCEPDWGHSCVSAIPQKPWDVHRSPCSVD